MEVLVYSLWSSDPQPLTARAKQALKSIDQVFTQATFWKAFHRRQTSPDQTFSATTEAELAKQGGKLSPLWEKTVAHFTKLKMDPNDITIDAAAYSEKIKFGVHVLLDDFKLEIEVEPDYLRKALTKHQTIFLSLLRDMGALTAIRGCWFRNQSAFAGDPVCLWEQPKKSFAKLSGPLSFREVTDEIRKVRESVQAAVSTDDWKRLLREAGAEVEKISSDRLFVKLSDPKGKGGAPVLRQLEKKIKPLLAE